MEYKKLIVVLCFEIIVGILICLVGIFLFFKLPEIVFSLFAFLVILFGLIALRAIITKIVINKDEVLLIHLFGEIDKLDDDIKSVRAEKFVLGTRGGGITRQISIFHSNKLSWFSPYYFDKDLDTICNDIEKATGHKVQDRNYLDSFFYQIFYPIAVNLNNYILHLLSKPQ